MKEDRDRWNRRYHEHPEPGEPSPLVAEFAGLARPGIALDIAAGQGRNALFLSQQGFRVEAVDISEKALVHMVGRSANLHPVCADLDLFDIPRKRYSLIVNMRYLSRRLLPQILMGLIPGGVLIFEALLDDGVTGKKRSHHPEYRLQLNELLHAFADLRIVYYRETSPNRKETSTAALVGIRGQ